jgi:hypothetical protein
MNSSLRTYKEMEKKGQAPLMSVLINSVYYFLEQVIIINEQDRYRLVVLNGERILNDNSFKSLKAARISFAKSYRHHLSEYETNKIKPEWTFFYRPDKKWLEQLLRRPH